MMKSVNNMESVNPINIFINSILESGVVVKNWQRKLRVFKDIHKSKPCILIGNGRSVRLDDLEVINSIDCVKFVFNRFHKIYDELDFVPNYTMSVDPLFIDDFFDELIESHRGQLLIGHHKELRRAKEFMWFKIKAEESFSFSDNPIKYTAPGGSVVVTALQIAYYMGCRDFYLYGIDHKFKLRKTYGNENKELLAKGDDNHFIQNYRSGKAWQPPDEYLIETAFSKCKQYIESNNGSLKNISRYSELDVLDKVDCDEVLNKLSNKFK